MSDNQIVNIEDATIFHHFKTILNNVNFQLKIGEFAYIIGETGSGKSSLLRTIYSDIPLKMGKIIVDGQDISNIKKSIAIPKKKNWYNFSRLPIISR